MASGFDDFIAKPVEPLASTGTVNRHARIDPANLTRGTSRPSQLDPGAQTVF